jgi:hypothetical protein
MVREYAVVRYRLRKYPLGYSAYDLNPARRRLIHMSKLPEFQLKLRQGGHQVLSISRISKEEYEHLKEEMSARKQVASSKG